MNSRISEGRRRELERLDPEDATEIDKHDLAWLAYEKDLVLYEYETRRWGEVWREAGKEPPPCPAIKPKEPVRPKGLDCERCKGDGYVRCHECGSYDKTCPDCEGTGDAQPAKKRRSA